MLDCTCSLAKIEFILASSPSLWSSASELFEEQLFTDYIPQQSPRIKRKLATLMLCVFKLTQALWRQGPWLSIWLLHIHPALCTLLAISSCSINISWKYASLVAQTVKNLPAMWDTWVWSLDQEDPLEKEMATHSSLLPWRAPWTEEPGGLQSMGSQRVGHSWSDRAQLHTII